MLHADNSYPRLASTSALYIKTLSFVSELKGYNLTYQGHNMAALEAHGVAIEVAKRNPRSSIVSTRHLS